MQRLCLTIANRAHTRRRSAHQLARIARLPARALLLLAALATSLLTSPLASSAPADPCYHLYSAMRTAGGGKGLQTGSARAYQAASQWAQCLGRTQPAKAIPHGEAALFRARYGRDILSLDERIRLTNAAKDIGKRSFWVGGIAAQQLAQAAFGDAVKLQYQALAGAQEQADALYEALAAEIEPVTKINKRMRSYLHVDLAQAHQRLKRTIPMRQLDTLRTDVMYLAKKGANALDGRERAVDAAYRGLRILVLHCAADPNSCNTAEQFDLAEKLAATAKRHGGWLRRHDRTGVSENDMLADTFGLIGELYGTLGAHELAQDYLDQAVTAQATAQLAYREHFAAGDVGNGLAIYRYDAAARNALTLNEPAKARDYLERGRRNILELMGTGQHTGANYYGATLLTTYVELLLQGGDATGAAEKLQLLRRLPQNPLPSFAATFAVRIALLEGNLETAQRELPKALRELSEAKQRAREGTRAAGVDQAGQLAQALLQADIEADTALELLAAAQSDWRAYRRRIGRFGDNYQARAINAQGQHLSRLTILAAWRTFSATHDRGATIDIAFQAAQELMSSSVTRTIRNASARIAAGDTQVATLIRKRQELEANWHSAQTGVLRTLKETQLDPTGTGSNRTVSRAQARRDGTAAAIDKLDANIALEFPDYHQLTNVEPLSVSATQALLADDEALLTIVPTDEATYVFAFTHNQVQWHRSTLSNAQIATHIASLRADIDAALAFGESDFNLPLSHTIYQELLAPVAPHIADRMHWYVAASRSMSSLGLGILTTTAPASDHIDDAHLRDASWLGARVALTHLPSPQALRQLKIASRSTNHASGYLGVGNPRLKGKAGARGVKAALLLQADSELMDPAKLRQLSALPGTADELSRVADTYKEHHVTLLTGKAATEKAIKKMDFSGVGLLHFATHGLVAGELNNVEPGLVLSPPRKATRQDDGYLSASEISALELSANWVILSACNTASSDGSVGAAGLSGLARAFIYAGAQSLLASHWEVADDVAPVLITAAIASYTNGSHQAVALRDAANAIRTNRQHPHWAHPAYWSPFIFVGVARTSSR